MTDVDAIGIDGYVSRLDDAYSFEDIEAALRAFVAGAGFRHYLLRIVLRLQPGPGFNLRITNYPATWLDKYADSGYNLIDPAAGYARTMTRPAYLHELPEAGHNPVLSGRFTDDAHDAGLYEGVTIPLCTTALWGFLNMNSPERPHLAEGAFGSSMIFSAALSEAVCRVTARTGLSETYGGLTRREREVLFWASSGKTAWETSEILGISERTVIAHLAKSMRTIGCVNKAQLIGAVAYLLDSDVGLQRFRTNMRA